MPVTIRQKAADCNLELQRLDFIPQRGHYARMADENTSRFEQLESHLAHLEHQVEQLNAVLIEQVKLVERLKKEVQRQSSALQTMELESIKSNNQKPPHYQ
jgi:uncharacterized coiled-coil protein SlyX